MRSAPLPASAGSRALVAELVERIERAGPLPFAEFMEAALYHPRLGYYTSGRVGLGGAGTDYRTSPEVHPIFGELLARQVVEMYRRLEEPRRFRVVELGPGSGRLAAAFLRAAAEALPDGLEAWEYHLLEISPALAATQRVTLAGLPAEIRERARWSTQEGLAAAPADGVILSNEFFDALPVHRVRMEQDRLREVRVGWRPGEGFCEVLEGLRDPCLVHYFEEYGVPLAEGQVAEVCLEALRWVDRVGRFLRRGYAITVDYGDRADGLYGPQRARGTLMAYRGHRAVEDPYRRVGEQDLTAHVNFTALERRGRERGLRSAPLRTQSQFLLALGILERMEEMDRAVSGEVARLQERLAVKELFVPGGMGEIFRVLVQAKGAPLEGLSSLMSPWNRAGGSPH